MSSVSVIVIAHRNHVTLSQTLKSVEDFSRHGDQLILVLNNPSNEVRKIASSICDLWRIILENNPGPQHARNAGAIKAKHDFLVFLDDDIQLTQGWIESMQMRFTSPWVVAGQGSIQLAQHPSLFWTYLRFTNDCHMASFHSQGYVKGTLDTAAVMMKTSWFRSIGGFHPELKMCEDTELSLRIFLHGGEIFLNTEPSVIQTYNANEGFISFFKKVYITGKYIVRLRKITCNPDFVFFEQFTWRLQNFKRFYKDNLVFMFLDLLKSLILELGINSFRHELDRSKRIALISHNKNKRL